VVYGDIMSDTTIKIHQETKFDLDTFREYKNESYDEVLKKVIFIAKNAKKEPELCRECIESIEKARERIRKGKFVCEADAKKRLGL
jgi:formylmethanofuran dehydrogenase subunit E